MTAPRSRATGSILVCSVLMVLVGGACGDDDTDEQTPDEASFCLLAELNEPVAEARAAVLERLDQLAPEEIDAAVVVLREAAEELDEVEQGSPDAVALEFEIRFRDDYVAARRQVERFIATECDDEVARSIGRGAQ